jgi:small-conductance mechanosensitive channel
MTIAETWIVDVLGLVDTSQLRSVTRSSLIAGGAHFVAYVAWQIIRFVTDSYVAQHSPVAVGPQDEEGPPLTATRLATLIPLLRIALAIMIVVVAVLVALSELGVNIMPLLAGASGFGLAISFGSQALVRDVISGIFYLTDDAFRVGEYIDCGNAERCRYLRWGTEIKCPRHASSSSSKKHSRIEAQTTRAVRPCVQIA